MMKETSRTQCISDNSSSDEELPAPVSLRERLERKRAIPTQTFLKDDIIVSKKTSASYRISEASNTIGTCTTNFLKDDIISNKSSASYGIGTASNTTNFLKDDISVSKTSSASYCIGTASNTISTTTYKEVLPSETFQFPYIKDSSAQKRDQQCDNGLINTKIKKKRTPDEIEESRKKAEEKKEERSRVKLAKEAEKQIKIAERESKKQFSLGSCLNYMTVLVDTHIVNTCGYGMNVFSACGELGVTCQTLELPCPFTIMWRRTLTECSRLDDIKVQTSKNEVVEGELLAVVPVHDFVHMVHTFKQEQGKTVSGGVTLKRYIQQLQKVNIDKNITTVVVGLDQYFKGLKSNTQKKHREAVQSTNTNYLSKMGKENERVNVSRVDIEQALTDAFLHTGANNFTVESSEEMADLVRRFTKAVAEKPAKKDRFDVKFSFHEEGASGVKVDKNGVGLLKVWKQQLMQIKNVSEDVAQALIAVFPSPQLLVQAYRKCESEKEAIKLLENIVVRRGAGVLETSRRVGKELSRRLFILFTEADQDFVIK